MGMTLQLWVILTPGCSLCLSKCNLKVQTKVYSTPNVVLLVVSKQISLVQLNGTGNIIYNVLYYVLCTIYMYLTMSMTLRSPKEKAMALGGVATGSIKAREAATVQGSITYSGCSLIAVA